MQFFTTTILASLLALATANTVTFQNQDSTIRTIVFTGNLGKAAIPSITIPANGQGKATFPTGWIGNWYAESAGSTGALPGMLGEVAFDGFKGLTYFDVSAIVDPNDRNGVKKIFPVVSKLPMSGCETFPCDNAYNLPDDIQTLTTPEKDLICLLGTKSASTSARRHAREFVTVASAEEQL